MLDRRDLSKFTKPLLIAMGSKTAFFLTLIIFLIASNLTGFAISNTTISHCDSYFNSKVSFYERQILMTHFIMTLFGFMASSLSLGLFGGLIIRIRKQQKQKQSQKKRLSQNRLKAHFIMAFIESICAINIFSRAVQKFNEHSVCNTQNKTNFIVVLFLSILISVILLYVLLILFRLLTIIQEKQKALEEYTFYSDQITLQENLLFNKTGYIKQLLKLQDYTSRSSSIKDDLIKNFPSGYKGSNDISPKRQIVYRLRGGNTQNHGVVMSNLSNPRIPEQENEGETSNNNDLNKSRFQQNASQQGKPLHLNLMAVNNDKTMDETGNDETLQYIQMAQNVIDLTVHKGLLEDLNEESEFESSEEESQDYDYQKLAMKKSGPVTPKKQKDIAQELKIEEELRQKFNLTSNTDLRRRYAHRKNQQNIDDYGNYFYVDVDKIKKRSKILSFNDQTNNVDPNLLYAQAEIPPRQKKLAKKHEKYVADYLKKLNKLKKQEMLFKEESSYQSEEDFDEQSEQSDSEEEQESSQFVDPTPVTVVDPVTGQPMTVMPQKKKKKNQGPQLYLYMKKRKNPGRDHKLKLFEDDSGFYDSEDSKENQQKQGEGVKSPEKGLAELNVNGEKMLISGASKEHQLQKSKHQEKLVLTNKRLDTEQARLLRFIRRKYISHEPQYPMPEMGNILPPNINGYQGYHPNYDPNQHQNMNPNQSMMQGLNLMNMSMGQIQDLSQSQNPSQYPQPNQYGQPNQYWQPNQNNSFQGNIFSPPPQNSQMSQMSPIKQNSGPGSYQMSSPQQSSPGFSTPFHMQTPPPFNNQPNFHNQMPYPNYQMPPQNYQPPPSYNQSSPQPNLMASLFQPNAPSYQPTTK